MTNKNQTELVTVELPRYRDLAGKPACALCFLNDDICYFLRYDIYDSFCDYVLDVVKRRIDQDGTPIPHEDCPLWKGVER